MLVCALMLAMSTLDTLMNGLASGLATDLAGMGVSPTPSCCRPAA